MTVLRDFKDIHNGKDILVCGCGESLRDLTNPERFITIGVNDVGRLFHPDYLVVVNPRRQFSGDRFRFVETSQAKYLFTQLDLGIPHQNIVKFKLGTYGGTNGTDPHVLHYTQNSPYVAVCLAAYMGAKRIGLIGVDFTDNHFFGKTGRHSLAGQLAQIDGQYRKLRDSLAARAIEVVNLSSRSRLTSLPKSPLDAFLQDGASEAQAAEENTGLSIVSYSVTPVAGVPAVLARCINRSTSHRSNCVWANNSYGNGVAFQGDIQWLQAPEAAKEKLDAADVVIVHNGKVAPGHVSVIRSKPVITMAHNYLWNVDQAFVQLGHPGIVVGQYQATLPEFKGWTVVPNPVPLTEPLYQPGYKNSDITICYTPSGKHESYARDHRLYWHAKGYETTMRILDRLAKRFPIKLEVIRERQVSHEESLRMKQRSHIVIDECVTGSYHRNSLEGLATGCVVVNGVGLLPGVLDCIQSCADSKGQIPFTFATLGTLEQVLAERIETGVDALLKKGASNRQWLEANWDFSKQWKKFWSPVVEQALRRKTSLAFGRGRKENENAFASASTATLNKSIRSAQQNVKAGIGKPEKKRFPGESIPVNWSCRGAQGNFGDMLSPLIVSALSGRPVHYSQEAPRLFAVGSLLKFARKGDTVWGSGFISSEDTCERGVRVSAVRGPLTRNKLLGIGVECPEIYGDPALLLPRLYPLPRIERSGIGIIPHYVDADRVRAVVRDPAVRVIDIRAGVEEVLGQANKCEVLLSSSLHGCILGDAYGIPTAWVHISDKVVGGGFKFLDYYASTEREPVRVDWRGGFEIDTAVHAAVLAPKPKIAIEPLLASFPYRQNTLSELEALRPQSEQSNPEAGARRIPEVKIFVPSAEADVTTGGSRAAHSIGSAGADMQVCQDQKLAIYCTGTENYAPNMATTLRSFMLHNEKRPFDYYVFGHSFSATTRALLARYGIHYVDMDLSALFPRNKSHRYPSECFWIFKGPEVFNEMGYEYSLSVDGDIWCNRRLDLDWLKQVNHIAGIDRGCSVITFMTKMGQHQQLKKHIPMLEREVCRIATNSGVLFYNNKTLTEFGFLKRLADLYNRSEQAGIARVGDDSTLALFLAAYPEIQLLVLDQAWNLFRGMYQRFSHNDPGYQNHFSDWINKAYLVHHAQIKPWDSSVLYPNYATECFITRWKNLWRDTLCQKTHTRALPSGPTVSGREKSIKTKQGRNIRSRNDTHVGCYWYRGTKLNAGDETAPYLLKKIMGRFRDTRLWEAPCDLRSKTEPVLFSVGSILRLCSANTVVWGSGIRNIDQPVNAAKQFCAVRGPLTRRRLLQLGHDCPETYGDPALLLPRFYSPVVNKRYALGVIPHLLDYALLSKLYGRDRKVLVINTATKDIESFVRQVLSCDCTVSSTLHGLIISIAYGVPTRWLRCSDKVMGDDTKFYDFFSSLDPAVMEALDPLTVTLPSQDETLKPYSPIRMEGDAIPQEELAAMTFRHNITIDLDKLLNACPIDGSGWKPGVLQHMI